jgi:hypothetical protein
MKAYLTIIALLITYISFGQTAIKKSSIDSGGDISTNGTLKIVYTIGEVALQENTTGNIHISEGFIGAIPTLNGTEAATICQGDIYTFGTQSLTMAGQYTETFTSVGGYDSTVTLTLTVNPTPEVWLGNDTSICDGNVLILDAGIFEYYFWNDNNNSETQTLAVTESGEYIVEVYNANNCFNTDTIIVNVETCTNINDISSRYEFLIYPNPASKFIIIESKTLKDESLQIFDIAGKVVLSSSFREGTTKQYKSIDISALQNGIYFVRIGVQVHKFVKK